MARARANQRNTKNWTMLALLIGGVGLLAVEMSAGMDYVQASLRHQMVDFLDCIPALGVTLLNVAQKAFWTCGSVESVLRVMPMVTLPFVLVAVGLALGRRTTR